MGATQGRILLNDALKEMETGNPFSISYVTLDIKRKTGGKIKKVLSAVLCGAKPPTENTKKLPTAKSLRAKPKRNPNHWDNQTRALQVLINGVPTSHIRKFHIFLITEFNNKAVYL